MPYPTYTREEILQLLIDYDLLAASTAQAALDAAQSGWLLSVKTYVVTTADYIDPILGTLSGAIVESEITYVGTHGTQFVYRTSEDILTAPLGQPPILNTPMLCSNAEWTAILAGNPATKFRHFQT